MSHDSFCLRHQHGIRGTEVLVLATFEYFEAGEVSVKTGVLSQVKF